MQQQPRSKHGRAAATHSCGVWCLVSPSTAQQTAHTVSQRTPRRPSLQQESSDRANGQQAACAHSNKQAAGLADNSRAQQLQQAAGELPSSCRTHPTRRPDSALLQAQDVPTHADHDQSMHQHLARNSTLRPGVKHTAAPASKAAAAAARCCLQQQPRTQAQQQQPRPSSRRRPLQRPLSVRHSTPARMQANCSCSRPQ